MEKEKLSSAIEVLESGARPKGGAVEYQADTIPSLGAEHLNDFGGFKFDKVKYVPKSFFNDMTTGIIRRGDILVVKDGATTGKVSLVDDSFPFEKAAINEHVFLLRVSKIKAFNKYVFHFLKSPIGQIEIQKDFRGATVGGISRRFIDLIKLPFPPIPDQIRIANILSKVEALISQRKESLRLLDELLKSTFLEMFGEYLNGNEEIFEPIGTVTNFIDYRGKTQERVESGIPHISAKCVRRGYFDETRLDFITEETYHRIMTRGFPKPNDVMFTTEGATMGFVCRVPRSFTKFAVGQRIITLQCKEKLKPEYLDYLLNHSSIQKQIFKRSSGSAAIGIRSAEFTEIKIPIAPLKLQTQFAHIVEKTEALKAHYQTSLHELENLYGSLSQRAFKGELSLK